MIGKFSNSIVICKKNPSTCKQDSIPTNKCFRPHCAQDAEVDTTKDIDLQMFERGQAYVALSRSIGMTSKSDPKHSWSINL
jgi:hypothetical protein